VRPHAARNQMRKPNSVPHDSYGPCRRSDGNAIRQAAGHRAARRARAVLEGISRAANVDDRDLEMECAGAAVAVYARDPLDLARLVGRDRPVARGSDLRDASRNGRTISPVNRNFGDGVLPVKSRFRTWRCKVAVRKILVRRDYEPLVSAGPSRELNRTDLGRVVGQSARCHQRVWLSRSAYHPCIENDGRTRQETQGNQCVNQPIHGSPFGRRLDLERTLQRNLARPFPRGTLASIDRETVPIPVTKT
jgi:hypothetical protein